MVIVMQANQERTSMDPVEILRSKVGGNQSAWARSRGISPAYVSDVLAGRRDPGKLILDAIGLERVVTYRRKKNAE